MKLDVLIAVELGDVVKDEKEYVALMIKELNVPYDNTLTKSKIYDKYKSTIVQKYGKPTKYPCLVVNYNNENNDTVTEFIYKNDILAEQKALKEKIKKLDVVINKIAPKKKNDFSFL